MKTRAIKFRVWDKGQDKFIDLSCGHHNIKLNKLFEDSEFVFQQFTGLQDENGRDVYEGDIVQLGWDTSDVHWSALKAEVVWRHNGFYFEVKDGALAQDTFYQFRYSEVIGNIFENL
jgi:uncharacterized phage protein (TIGR01671 family)